ncbi:galactose oxidase-like domain-containing protein [Streptomyces sp. NPDC047108]|uniref:galactose oxidase-like domain-containing protein n=1 Tax=Streptomyces sp. NPDC047108 TaxID=3155025 RepID=UPI0033C6580E
MKYRPSRRTRRIAIGTTAVLVLAGMNGPALFRFGSEKYHAYKINRPEYKAENGHWDLLDVPEEFRINTIHAALLHTGKVLLIAGSGNNAEMFKAKTFRTVLWDPEKNTYKNISTPKDMFCAGHTQLPDGKLLVAGGTQRYEKLQGDVEKAGGLMIVKNEDPDEPKTLRPGTLFTGKSSGKTFESKDNLLVPRAKKTTDPVTGEVKVTASEARVYVEARKKGQKYSTGDTDNYRISGLSGNDARNLYGIANKLSFDKKDFQGIKDSFEFDPVAEKYIRVDPMHEARWYPTLTTLQDGRVLSVSGLDEIGQVVPGKNEVYDPDTKKWTYLPTKRFFPTYPALFLTDGGKIFYSGSNAGYGPADKGRTPGLWDVDTNEFDPVPGMSDPKVLETSMSVMLPPAQDQKFMVIGGGGVGESQKSSEKTRVVDLRKTAPRFRNGAPLSEGTRYPGGSILPDDTVFVSGGSGDYRGRSGSNILKAQIYDAKNDTFRRVADPTVGRNYHSGTLLLPDGRIMIFGSDSLYSDDANTKPGVFEKRIEIYTPPYLYRDKKPELGAGPERIARGGSATFATNDAADVKSARLMRPSAVTHVTDVDQRSIALDVRKTGKGVRVTVPDDRSLVPSGWYMLFVTDKKGTPSKARWVEVP